MDADDIGPGDQVRWGDEIFTVERVSSDGSLRHLGTAERPSLVLHALEQVELLPRPQGRSAA